MVWTDSQDYGSDEILFHPFALTPPVQRAACALHFQGSPQEPTEIVHLIKYRTLFLTYHIFLKGVSPDFPSESSQNFIFSR